MDGLVGPVDGRQGRPVGSGVGTDGVTAFLLHRKTAAVCGSQKMGGIPLAARARSGMGRWAFHCVD